LGILYGNGQAEKRPHIVVYIASATTELNQLTLEVARTAAGDFDEPGLSTVKDELSVYESITQI
jgi:hypothetical protein